MAEYSRRRRMIGTAVAGSLAVVGAVLLIDQAVARLTPQQARAALVRELPELQDALVSEHNGRVVVGDYEIDLSAKSWHGRTTRELLGKELPEGRFERRPFGRWRAVETGRWTLLCIYDRPVTP
jgi:hypothetical protein